MIIINPRPYDIPALTRGDDWRVRVPVPGAEVGFMRKGKGWGTSSPASTIEF